jgi:monoamine oxidase
MTELAGCDVAVVGAGFAGLTAAFRLRSYGAQVTLYEARDTAGGRVRTDVVDGRVLEIGAELIGSNHPCWLKYATLFGLDFRDVTTADEYVAEGLQPQVRLGGVTLEPALAHEVEGDVHEVQHLLSVDATEALPGDLAHHPWDAPRAAELDARNLAEWVDECVSAMRLEPDRDARLRAFLAIEFESHMTVPLDRQSLLASFACVAGGGGDGYWTDTEVYRCAEGNQSLADRMLERMRTGERAVTFHPSTRVTAIDVAGGRVTVTSSPAAGGAAATASYDYAVVAVPPTVWPGIAVGGSTGWFPGGAPGQGPAVKYLGLVDGPYWRDDGMAPSGFDDALGQVWEGTDRQGFSGNLCLTAFAGGTRAAALREGDFPPALERLLPGFERSATDHVYANWPREPYVMTGYSCPAPGQVTDHQRRMQLPVQDRIFLAGEACSPAFFGYMEGALQSGEAAADRIRDAAASTS